MSLLLPFYPQAKETFLSSFWRTLVETTNDKFTLLCTWHYILEVVHFNSSRKWRRDKKGKLKSVQLISSCIIFWSKVNHVLTICILCIALTVSSLPCVADYAMKSASEYIIVFHSCCLHAAFHCSTLFLAVAANTVKCRLSLVPPSTKINVVQQTPSTWEWIKLSSNSIVCLYVWIFVCVSVRRKNWTKGLCDN